MKEILEKAIQKAIDGGFEGYWKDRYERCKELSEMEFLIVGNIYEEGHSPEELLFSKDFAKALWGEESYSLTIHDVNTPSEYANSIMVQQPMWSYRLQQMVIADDPIEYLGEHI